MAESCGNHDWLAPSIGGFFAVCLDCGYNAMRPGRHSWAEVLPLLDSAVPESLKELEGHLFADNEPEISRLQAQNDYLLRRIRELREEVLEVAALVEEHA